MSLQKIEINCEFDEKEQRKRIHRIYKQNARENSAFKARVLEANRKHKHEAREDREYKAREIVANRKHMHKTRQDRDYKAKELESQRKYKQNARKNMFVLECERVKKQE